VLGDKVVPLRVTRSKDERLVFNYFHLLAPCVLKILIEELVDDRIERGNIEEATFSFARPFCAHDDYAVF
jgi:hypothetical protein